MRTEAKLLLVDDEIDTCRQLAALLNAELGIAVEVAGSMAEAKKHLDSKPALLISDLRLPDGDGMQLLNAIQENHLATRVIVMTGVGGVNEAIEAMRLGALDFLTKPVDTDRLIKVVERALRERALEDEIAYLQRQVDSDYSYRSMLSKSPTMQRIFDLVEQLGETATTVLIVGETGTGKERLARAIHEASNKHRTGPFVPVNCAAVPETLFESELFGHEKGSFTGAHDRRKGKFESAQGGTLFLDEVGEMPISLQPKLLRALQERQIERVGSSQPISVDVRVVAATNKSLERQVRRGKFREDLFYRLNVVRLELPPLRERPEDVPLLVKRFAEKFAPRGKDGKRFSPAAMQSLMEHAWPGNVRELENLVERVSVTVANELVEPSDLMLTAAPAGEGRKVAIDLSKPLTQLISETVADLEKRYLTRALAKARGNVGHCAKLTGLSRRSISAKLAEYGFNKREFKDMASR
jgi:DNA-binding NtrC family response regulator